MAGEEELHFTDRSTCLLKYGRRRRASFYRQVNVSFKVWQEKKSFILQTGQRVFKSMAGEEELHFTDRSTCLLKYGRRRRASFYRQVNVFLKVWQEKKSFILQTGQRVFKSMAGEEELHFTDRSTCLLKYGRRRRASFYRQVNVFLKVWQEKKSFILQTGQRVFKSMAGEEELHFTDRSTCLLKYVRRRRASFYRQVNVFFKVWQEKKSFINFTDRSTCLSCKDLGL
ncbi:hypothetical protein BgiBS90_004052 [Biomphalaria glabrata]|nr:hypothetical protein BgiBS90_004052 [Biomphalaria glabrata]